MKIAILDDQKSIVDNTGKFLKAKLEDVEIFNYYSPRDFLKDMTNKDFDILITDIGMDGTDGIHVINLLNNVCDTDIIVITGNGCYEVAKLKNMGKVKKIFEKPFSCAELLNEINSIKNDKTITLTEIIKPECNAKRQNMIQKFMDDIFAEDDGSDLISILSEKNNCSEKTIIRTLKDGINPKLKDQLGEETNIGILRKIKKMMRR